MRYLGHFLVGDREVHEDFSHDEIEVGHAVDFLDEVGDISEQFMEILIGGDGVLGVHVGGFERLDFPVEFLGLGELVFEVLLVLAHQHLVALVRADEVFHVLGANLGVAFLRLERFEFLFALVALRREDALHFGDVVLVPLFGGERVMIEEIEGGFEDNLGAGGFAVRRAIKRVATVVKQAFGDAGGHGTVAATADDHATHEVGHDAAPRLDDVGELVGLLHTVELADTLEILGGHGGHEIVLVEQVDHLLAENHHARVQRVTQQVGNELLVDDELAVLGDLGSDRIAPAHEEGGDGEQRLPREAHGEDLADKVEVLLVRSQEMELVLVVAVLAVAARPFALGGLAADGAADVLRVRVRKLLRHDEGDAEQHLAGRVVVEDEIVGEAQVLDIAMVEHVDDFVALLHVPCQPIRCPADDAVILARTDAVEHRPELLPFVRHHGRFLLMDDLHPAQAKPLCQGLALVNLVADGAFLLLRRVRALAGVYDVSEVVRTTLVTLPNAKSPLEAGYKVGDALEWGLGGFVHKAISRRF